MKKTFTPPVCDLIILRGEDVLLSSYNGSEIDVDNKNGGDVDLPFVGMD